MGKAEDGLSKCVRINITLQKEIPSHCKQLLLFKKEEKKSWPINYLSPTYFLSSMGCNKVLLFIKDQTHTVCFVCGESSGFNLEFGCPPLFCLSPPPLSCTHTTFQEKMAQGFLFTNLYRTATSHSAGIVGRLHSCQRWNKSARVLHISSVGLQQKQLDGP